MDHLTEIKPSVYVLNLSKFEENEVAKSKKKSTPVKKVRRSTDPQQVPTAPAAEQIVPAAEQTVPTVEAAVPAVDGQTVVIDQTKVSYDEDTRLYTIEFKGEFCDDSRDLDKTMRVIRELVPGVTEKELSALKEL